MSHVALRCAACGFEGRAGAHNVEKRVKCPGCGQSITVPSMQTATAPTAATATGQTVDMLMPETDGRIACTKCGVRVMVLDHRVGAFVCASCRRLNPDPAPAPPPASPPQPPPVIQQSAAVAPPQTQQPVPIVQPATVQTAQMQQTQQPQPTSTTTAGKPMTRKSSTPWYYHVCRLATLALGAYSFAVLGLLTVGAVLTLMDAMTRRAPQAYEADFRGLSVGIAFLQLGAYFGGMLATVALTTLVLVILDAGLRLREVKAALERTERPA